MSAEIFVGRTFGRSIRRQHSPSLPQQRTGSRPRRIAQAHKRDKVARTRNGYRCIPRSTARDYAEPRALLGDGLRLA